MAMTKELINALSNLGLIGTVGGGYKCRVWIQTDGSTHANAYAGPLTNALAQLIPDRVLCMDQKAPLAKLFYGANSQFNPETWAVLREGDKELGSVGRPYFDLVHLIVTHEGVKQGCLPEAAQLEKSFIGQGIGVVLTQVSSMGSGKEMRATSEFLWPPAFSTTSIVNLTLQRVEELLYGTIPKDNGRAVLTGWGVLPQAKDKDGNAIEPKPIGPVEGRVPKIGTFIEPELTANRLGYAMALIELVAKAGWDLLLIAPGLSKQAVAAINALIVDNELAIDIDFVDKLESQLDIVGHLATCDATVWLPDGEHAFGQDWRVAVGAAARVPVIVMPSPRTEGYREDAAGAVSFCWTDTGQDEIASILYGMDPSTNDGKPAYDVWKKRVTEYAELRSWSARAEEVLVAYAKALQITEDRRMKRILRQGPRG